MNQYTFDGCGINGPDEFKTQVLTITRPEQRNNPEVVAFCKKAAAAEELLDALVELFDYTELGIEKDLGVFHNDAVEALAKARSAIKKAKGE